MYKGESENLFKTKFGVNLTFLYRPIHTEVYKVVNTQ